MSHDSPATSNLNMILAWNKPEHGWHKLNIDGSAKNFISAGGVLRNHLGLWIIGFGKFIGVGSCILAETWALFIGLQTTSKHQINKIEIEIDSQELFNLINKDFTNLHPFGNAHL